MINWKVRIRNKNFWLAFIPAILIIVKQALAIFGIEIDLSGVSGAVVNIIEEVFLILGLIGIINDPTTEGLGDSYRAMGYDKPYEKV